MQENRLNLSAGLASVAVATVLVGLKLWALAATGALSVAAALTDSALDLMMSLVALAAIAYAAKPADADHAYGHNSAEDLAALAQSLVILGSAGLILWLAVGRLFTATPDPLAAEGRGIVVMVISIVLTLGLVIWQRRVAARTGSKVVTADSLHYLGDLMPNLGAIFALWASARFGVARIDAVIAIAAALFLIYGALKIGRGAWDALMDRAADDDIVARIEDIARNFPGVFGFHDLKTRQAGSRIFVALHIELDGTQSLDAAHAIGAALRRAILREFPRADVMIHKDPIGVAPHPDDPQKEG